MPYLGDAPSNPVPLTLTGGAAVGEAAGPTENDRHVCWFSVPAQAAGNSLRVNALVGGEALDGLHLRVVLIWDGGNTAHYINWDSVGARQSPALREIPAGEDILIGVFPVNHSPMALGRFDTYGADLGLTPLTASEWDAQFPPDLTKRLPADTELSVEVVATTYPAGTDTTPLVMDFTTSQAAQTFDLDAWQRPTFAIEVLLPAGFGVELTTTGDPYPPPIVLVGGELVSEFGTTAIYKPDTELADQTLNPSVYGPRPSGTLSVRAVRIADISGTGIDTDGASPEPCNVLLFRTADAIQAVEAPSGNFTMPDVPAGDYIAVFFSRADGRDVRATNVLVPPGTRVAGGGYPFP